MQIQMAKNAGRVPTDSELKYSVWVREGMQRAFIPTQVLYGKGWYLIELDNPNNGYDGGGSGWDTVREMFDAVGDQFDCLIPFDSLVLNAYTTVKL